MLTSIINEISVIQSKKQKDVISVIYYITQILVQILVSHFISNQWVHVKRFKISKLPNQFSVLLFLLKFFIWYKSYDIDLLIEHKSKHSYHQIINITFISNSIELGFYLSNSKHKRILFFIETLINSSFKI